MAIRMTRVDPAKNMARWYEIDVQQTLFGEYTVERHWGRIGATGQSKTFWFDDEATADQMAISVSTRPNYNVAGILAKFENFWRTKALPLTVA